MNNGTAILLQVASCLGAGICSYLVVLWTSAKISTVLGKRKVTHGLFKAFFLALCGMILWGAGLGMVAFGTLGLLTILTFLIGVLASIALGVLKPIRMAHGRSLIERTDKIIAREAAIHAQRGYR